MAYTLDTNIPLRLVGIQLFEETAVNIRKSLQPGWYAFIHTKEDIGTNKKKKPVLAEDVCPYGFYNTDEGLPRIYISAIAGKNGSGKSSILDILYRILNNFASAIFSTEVGENADEVVLTCGLYARLYFEQDGVSRYIDVADDAVRYVEYDGKEEDEWEIYGMSDKERNELLNRFFYTISVNYSIYAFNPYDYVAPLGEEQHLETYNGYWLHQLFHKNDGYYIPLVLTPFRNKGEMSVTNENVLAEQRISVLSLLYHSQKKEFLEDYIPYKLCYQFDKEYKNNKMETFRKKLCEELKPCIDVIIEHFVQAWQKYFDEQKIELEPDRQEMELFYFAYKSVKICLTYPEYKDLFELEDLLGQAKTLEEHYGKKEYNYVHIPKEDEKKQKIVGAQDCVTWMNAHTQNVKDVVKAILNDNGRHITAKIFQTLNYLRGTRYKQGDSIKANELIEKRYETYDEVMTLMPPPFFKSEIHYIKAKDKKQEPEEIMLRNFSSGEKQLLYSISYICYHIKNIASNKENGKRVVGYHHINLIFDEAELYYHPEFQREFVKRLLERLAMCHVNRSNIRSVNILIVTHSPFILSDIPESNVLYLGAEDGHEPSRTFGANIYDLLQDSFFLKSDIGEVAQMKIDEMMRLYNSENSAKKQKEFDEKYDELEYIYEHLGEAYLKKTYGYMLEKLREQYKPDKAKDMWRQRLNEVEQERERLTKLLES